MNIASILLYCQRICCDYLTTAAPRFKTSLWRWWKQVAEETCCSSKQESLTCWYLDTHDCNSCTCRLTPEWSSSERISVDSKLISESSHHKINVFVCPKGIFIGSYYRSATFVVFKLPILFKSIFFLSLLFSTLKQRHKHI